MLNKFEIMFVKRCIFIIVFQFTIIISILWQLLEHNKMIEKTMSITQYRNSYKICSKLFHKNKTLMNENSMLMILILFFVLFFFLYVDMNRMTRLCWNDEMTSWRRVVFVCWKGFSFWGLVLGFFFHSIFW